MCNQIGRDCLSLARWLPRWRALRGAPAQPGRTLCCLAIFLPILAAIGIVAALGPARAAGADGGTTVPGGDITSNTTWTITGSPYIVVGNVIVDIGVTLTVQPGVEVRFAATELLVNGTLEAEGTAAQPITFTSAMTTPQPGDWYDIAIDGSGNAHARLAYCDIGYGGRSGSGAQAMRISASDVVLRNCTLHDSSTSGIQMYATYITPTLDSVAIVNNAGWAITYRSPAISPFYHNLTLTGNGFNNAVLATCCGDPLGVSANWTLTNAPYYVSGLSINAGATLTLAPGVRIQMGSNATFYVDGTLIADGTPAQPITFTSVMTTPQPGDWNTLEIISDGRADFAYCDIGYGGTSGQLVFNETSAFVMQHCTLHDSSQNGIQMYATTITPTVHDIRLINNAYAGLTHRDGAVSPDYRDIFMSGNGTNGLVICCNTGVAFSGNGLWTLLGYPTIVGGNAALQSSLVITPGVQVQMANGASFEVMAGGLLYAVGTDAQPITFTTPLPRTPGTWGGIQVDAGGSALLSRCDIGYGGSNSTPMLSLVSGAVVENCNLHDSAYDGIRVASAQPGIAGNGIYSNAYGLRNTSGVTISALNNWWGDASGPYNAASNPGGQGNAVGDQVIFNPWLGSPPTSTVLAGLVALAIAGPKTTSAGATADYAITYDQQYTSVVQSAVLMVALPYAAAFVDATDGGIYWPEKHQVFWRLGDLPIGAIGTVSVKVQYYWGVLPHLNDSLLALMGGSNLSQDGFDTSPYLAYNAPTASSDLTLTPAQLTAELVASPDLNALYTRFLAGGYTLGEADSQTLSDGEIITQVVLTQFAAHAVLYLRRTVTDVLYSYFDPLAYGIGSTTGGITVAVDTGLLSYWGDWNPGTAPAHLPAALSRGQCFFNCLVENLPMWVISNKIKAVGAALNTIDCIKWAASGDHEAGAKCTAALKKIPGVGEALDVKKCMDDCGKDPSSHVCTHDIITCNGGWNFWALLGIPSYRVMSCGAGGTYLWGFQDHWCFNGEKCVEGQGCVGCGGGSAPASGALKLSAPDRDTTTASLCTLLAQYGIACGYHTTQVLVAGDPNAKFGPAGDLVPGELVTYTIDFANEGTGSAYGVFVQDTLDPSLDDSTLTLYGGTYLTASRTLFWDVGTLAPAGQPSSSGVVSFTVRVKSGLPGGTAIINQAVIHFPSVPSATATNPVVNVVEPVSAVPQTLHTPELTPVDITLQGYDASGAPLTYTVTGGPLNGVLDGIAPTVRYTPGVNFNGLDSFSFVASNGVTTSRPAQVQIIVDPSALDTIPPTIVWTEPISGAAGVMPSGGPVMTDGLGAIYGPLPTLQFSEAISATTLSTQTVRLTDNAGRVLSISLNFNTAFNQLLVLPREPLHVQTVYTLTLSTGITDLAGNPLAAPYVMHFRTGGWLLYLPIVRRN